MYVYSLVPGLISPAKQHGDKRGNEVANMCIYA